MEPKKDEFYIIDASSYLYRGYFAIRQELTTKDGFPTKAIYNVTNMLWKVLREKDPAYVAVVWDHKGPNFRHDIYPQYKANRPPMPQDLVTQVPLVKDIVDALGLRQLEVEGVEADDTIATLAKGILNVKKVIVSGDKDLLQLVGEDCIIWDPMKDQWIDANAIKEQFHLDPERLVDVQALSGDASDNIPGVKGIGKKTALKLIQAFGSVEALLDALDTIKKGKMKANLEAQKEEIPLFKRLVALKKDCEVDLELDAYERQPPDTERLKELFERLEFTRFLNDLIPPKKVEYSDYKVVKTVQDLKDLENCISNAHEIVVDTETDHQDPMMAKLVGIAICPRPPEAYYIPLDHKDAKGELDLSLVKTHLGHLFSDEKVLKIGHNIKYDIIVLRQHGIKLQGVSGDTMVASYLLDPTRRQHNLEALSKEHLGHAMITFKDLMRGKKNRTMRDVSVDEAAQYACEDAHVTALLKEIFWKRLKELGLWELFEQVEVPLIQVLARMEETGVHIDLEGLKAISEEFQERIKQIEEEIFALSGERFNLNSPKQLQEVLFGKLGLSPGKKTRKKTGHSTDIEVLRELRKSHPIAELLLQYRNLTKLMGTYIKGLEKMVNPRTHRIHTSYNQTVTATGRLSSSNPNLQNIPVKTEEGLRIRSLFVASPGHSLISADYSQIDLRVLAHVSGDKALIQAFKQGEDVHKRTASEIFDVHPAFVTYEMRRVAKTVNFGIVYGMSPFGLAKELGIERNKAKAFIERYFQRYPGVRSYMTQQITRAKETGFVTTILGRRRYIPEIKSRVKHIRAFAERTAINTPIQGSAADIIKLAMLRVHEFIEAKGLRSRLILQVHDELVLEVPEDEISVVTASLKELMEGVLELKVPLVANIAMGKDWAKAKA